MLRLALPVEAALAYAPRAAEPAAAVLGARDMAWVATAALTRRQGQPGRD